jgi:hypothetical protein
MTKQSGYQVARWSRAIRGTTVSTAHSSGLKQRAWPPPQGSTPAAALSTLSGALMVKTTPLVDGPQRLLYAGYG